MIPMFTNWQQMLLNAMALNGGKGQRFNSVKRSGKGADRRGDKRDGTPKILRAYQSRYGQ